MLFVNKLYNICTLSENIDLFVQALEMDRKVDIWQAFLICLAVSANKFYFCLRKMRQKISWTDGRTEVKQYTPLPLRGAGV
jgi:hypothetical protein